MIGIPQANPIFHDEEKRMTFRQKDETKQKGATSTPGILAG
jgi:hypothetical protein